MTMTATTANDQDHPGDNLFGVCAALGGEFGFNPLWLRLAFAVTFLANPVLVAGTYFALGAVVVISRIATPRRRANGPAVERPVAVSAAAPAEAEEPLPLAA